MKTALRILFLAHLCVPVPVLCLSSGEGGQECSPVVDLDDGWRVSTPAAEGMDQAQVARISAEIESGRFEGIHSYLVIKNGALVHEAYFGDWNPDSLQVIFSITKSITSTLVGIALERGEIPSLQATLPDLLPEYADDIADPLARTVNLEHLLFDGSGRGSCLFAWREGIVLKSEVSSSFAGRVASEEIGRVIPFQSEVQMSVEVEPAAQER